MREAGFFETAPLPSRCVVHFSISFLWANRAISLPSLHLLACLLASPPALLEDDFVAGLQDIFEAKIMFKRVLGLKIPCLRPEGVAAHMARRVEPVGTTPTTASTAEPSMLRWMRWMRWLRWARATWMRARC